MQSYKVKRTIIGQIERGADLYNSLMRIIQNDDITLGRITALGAVEKSRVAFYDQRLMKYIDIEINEPMEILNLYGNISLKDGKPFVHAHIMLSDERGVARGGHLLPDGTPVFACEVVIEEFEGPVLDRISNPSTGLALWPADRVL